MPQPYATVLMAAVVLGVLGRLLKGPMCVIPYGPYLAGAAVLVMIFGGGSQDGRVDPA